MSSNDEALKSLLESARKVEATYKKPTLKTRAKKTLSGGFKCKMLIAAILMVAASHVIRQLIDGHEGASHIAHIMFSVGIMAIASAMCYFGKDDARYALPVLSLLSVAAFFGDLII